MKNFWLNKKENKKLIVFFSGWGMDEKSVQHIDCGSFDVLIFFDYRNLEIDEKILGIINSYPEIHLTAWSMGVMICSSFRTKISQVTTATAIAGTLKPIDDKFGIPVKIYDLTAQKFNDLSKKKFLRKMFAADDTKFINRTTEGLKAELIALQSYTADENMTFDKAIVPNCDKIIPSENQLKYWTFKACKKIEKIDGGHYPFLNFKSWSEIIK